MTDNLPLPLAVLALYVIFVLSCFVGASAIRDRED